MLKKYQPLYINTHFNHPKEITSTGNKAKIAYFSSVGDFNYLGSRGKLPTYIFGPQGKNYHSPDEYVELNTIVKTAEVIYDFLKKVLI
ncbi:M20/M25/M40 family metallo-hydrolase [bacterium]|nr:M20/M25/M40 family metallo-hydrolase [bacterium]MBU4362169.1 M20/M25/M40 family metallo-hydrolase [bacterium]MBU4603016.1 M20/M25/M40 family metallo-hydrolase [bacterium]